MLRPNPVAGSNAVVTSASLYSAEGCNSSFAILSYPYTLSPGSSRVWYQAFITSDGSSEVVGADSLSFRAVDDVTGALSTNSATVTINVLNNIRALAATALCAEDTRSSIILEGMDSGGGSAFTIYILSVPSIGSLYEPSSASPIIINSGVGYLQISGTTVEYLPTQNSWGAAFTSFTFRVSDSSGTFSAPATITIDVAAVNDAPTLELTSPPAGTFFATVYKNDVNVVASVDFTLADNDEPTSPAATYRCDVDPGPCSSVCGCLTGNQPTSTETSKLMREVCFRAVSTHTISIFRAVLLMSVLFCTTLKCAEALLVLAKP